MCVCQLADMEINVACDQNWCVGQRGACNAVAFQFETHKFTSTVCKNRNYSDWTDWDYESQPQHQCCKSDPNLSPLRQTSFNLIYHTIVIRKGL
ncbi:hypothetical protein PoB_001381000 [Plakobranchus ocellatus]|uniref:Uncharacterized protein n=1 Tax=Plakobranchus ocellatus TaxID=259542 RepID=A0AAV3YVQ4_9GAST|nr:hypothetical protein PoB_001381000 [Plakobranchus ocellatus]